jgi:N-methylhydantoinase B
MDIDTGATVRQITPGSGGYGDPHDRDPQLVLEDVVDGKVSVIRARSDYDVIVDTEAGTAIRSANRRAGAD